MPYPPNIFSDQPIAAQPVADNAVSDAGFVLTDIKAVLSAFGVDLDDVASHLPQIMPGGVQGAPTGALQDPAGSAVGRSFAGAGGASGAIYQHFNGLPNANDHLDPIPAMPVGASVCNASKGAGGRVVHTYSPSLMGRPSEDADRGKALADVANGYLTALQAFDNQAADLGADGKLLNLVPISASIFAGPFAFHTSGYPGNGHLHPSYSITAVLLAVSAAKAAGVTTIPPLTLYYFDNAVRTDAEAIVSALSS